MRIISKFHDYYDCIQRMGQDLTIVYLREEKVVEDWPFPGNHGVYGNYYGNKTLSLTHVIGFCGKITPLVKLRPTEESPYRLCWSLDDVDTFMAEHLKKHKWITYRKSRWSQRSHYMEFFTECVQKESSFEYLFRDNHSPLFVATVGERRKKSQIVFNTSLRDVEFYTRFDSYQAFQEIAMYMGGVLGTHGGHKTKYKGEPMSSEVSDSDLAAAKGFDKFSFRKGKED